MTQEIKAIITTIVALILSAGFLGVGMLKLISYPALVQSFERWHLPLWSMYLIGLTELALAFMLFYKPMRLKGLMIGGVLMIGACIVHILGKEYSQLYGPVVVLFLLVVLYFAGEK